MPTLRRLLVPGPGALVAVLVALPAALSRYADFDVFFNLAGGRWILAHGFPSVDPFSVTASGPWFPHEWGFGALAALALQALGALGPKLLLALILSGQVLLLWRLLVRAYGKSGLWPLFALCLTLYAQADTLLYERAFHAGHLMFVLALTVIQEFRRGRSSALAWMPALAALWANLHGTWIAAPALLAAVVLGELLQAKHLTPRVRWGALAVLGSFAAAALSPEGWRTCLYPLGFLVHGSSADIQEWHAMSLACDPGRAALAAMLLCAFFSARSTLRQPSLWLPAVGFSVLTVLAERFAPLAVMCLVLLLLESLAAGPAIHPTGSLGAAVMRFDGWLQAWGDRAGGALWPVLAVGLCAIPALQAPASLQERLDPGLFPVRSLQTLAALPADRVLNSYHLGGLVSCLAGPEHKVFIDGRNDPFPPEVHRDYRRLVLLEPGWPEVIARYRPRYLLWSTAADGTALLDALHRQGGWKVLADDGELGVLWEAVDQPELKQSVSATSRP